MGALGPHIKWGPQGPESEKNQYRDPGGSVRLGPARSGPVWLGRSSVVLKIRRWGGPGGLNLLVFRR